MGEVPRETTASLSSQEAMPTGECHDNLDVPLAAASTIWLLLVTKSRVEHQGAVHLVEGCKETWKKALGLLTKMRGHTLAGQGDLT